MAEEVHPTGSAPQLPKSLRNEKLIRAAFFCASFAIVLAIWALARALHIVNPELFPSIPAVWQAGVRTVRDGSLLTNIAVSFLRVLIGFFLGMLLAIIFGSLIGSSRVLRLLADPAINFFRALPPIALIPLMIILFGIGELPKIVVLTYASFFPALVVIYQAFVSMDPIYARAARTLGATNGEVFRKVTLPLMVPAIVTAARVSLGVAWATLVAAELVAAQRGIGAMMVDAQAFFQMPVLVLGVLMIGAISLAMDTAVRTVERRLTLWQ